MGIAIVVAALTASACGGGAATPSATTSATAAATAAATASPTPIVKREVSYAGPGSTSSHYLHFVAKTKVWNEYVPEVNVTLTAAGSPTQNVAQLGKQFDIVNYDPVAGIAMYNGTGAFQGKAIPDLRIMFNDVDFVNMIMVRDDSGVNSIYDLDGKAFNPGIPGSSAETAIKAAFDVLGIKPNYFAAQFADAVAAIQNKRIVGYVKATAVAFTPDATMRQLASTTKMKTIGFTKEDSEKVLAKYTAYTMLTVPAGVEGGFYGDKDVIVFSAGLGQALLKDFPADLVYKMVKAVFEHKAEIDQAYPGYAKYDLAAQTIKYAKIPLHAGTVRYLKEVGVSVPAELVPPEAK